MIFPERQAEFKSKIFRSVGFTNIKKCGILCERKGRLTTSSRDLFPVAFLRDAKFFPKRLLPVPGFRRLDTNSA